MEDLKAKVIVSLTANIKRHPAIGWVRADLVPTDATVREVLNLRERVASLEAELNRVRTEAPPGTEELMHGEDTFRLEYECVALPPDGSYSDRRDASGNTRPTWDEIFAGVAPVLINEASEGDLRRAFKRHFERIARADLEGDKKLKDWSLDRFSFKDEDLDTCLVQLRALGLIKESDRKRSVSDTSKYWALTPYGDRLMVQLRALRRQPPEPRALSGQSDKRSVDKNT